MADDVITREQAAAALEVILEQEKELRYEGPFGSAEALELGAAMVSLGDEFDESFVITIERRSDGAIVFQWLPNDKGERNLVFAAGKRAGTAESGHAAPWKFLETLAKGEPVDALFANAPSVIHGAGGFPVRVGEEWVATIGVSGLHEGLDHEVIVRALERVLHKQVPRYGVKLR